MSTEIAIKVFPSDPDYLQAVFGPHAFDGQVGEEIRVGTATGVLVSAFIAEDGSCAWLRLRMPDAVAEEWMRPRITGRVDEHGPIEHSSALRRVWLDPSTGRRWHEQPDGLLRCGPSVEPRELLERIYGPLIEVPQEERPPEIAGRSSATTATATEATPPLLAPIHAACPSLPERSPWGSASSPSSQEPCF